MINRKQKINLLKGIVIGSRSINELLPLTYDVWMCTDNKTYFNSKTGIRLPIDELIKRYGKEKSINVTINIE